MNSTSLGREALAAMLRKAEEKLAAGRNDWDQGFYGDAASRAYYAVYHAICAVLAERELSFTSHGQTLGAFNREFVQSGLFPPDTFRKIQRLFEDRQLGDYDWERSLDRDEAEADLNDARRIITACRNYLEAKTGRSFPTESSQ